MDCFSTLSDEEETIRPEEIRYFLEAVPVQTDYQGNVTPAHGAAICQSSEDWSKEHTALELACQKLGASCTYDIKKIITDVDTKMQKLQNLR